MCSETQRAAKFASLHHLHHPFIGWCGWCSVAAPSVLAVARWLGLLSAVFCWPRSSPARYDLAGTQLHEKGRATKTLLYA
jgi:hypothetical protein